MVKKLKFLYKNIKYEFMRPDSITEAMTEFYMKIDFVQVFNRLTRRSLVKGPNK